MKFFASALFVASVVCKIRDRKNGILNVNDDCVPDRIIKQNRCAEGLVCETTLGKCKIVVGGTCTTTDQCTMGNVCTDFDCKKAVQETSSSSQGKEAEKKYKTATY